jgi:hypothetical protein
VRRVWLGGRDGPRGVERRIERLQKAIPDVSRSPRMRSLPQRGMS